MSQICIHERIAELRREKGITQEALAVAMGVTNQSVSKWEAGLCCPDIQLLPELAAFFCVTTDYLLGYAPPLSAEPASVSAKADPLFASAVQIAQDNRTVSASSMQRHLSVGYNRAKRLIDALLRAGYIEPCVRLPEEDGKPVTQYASVRHQTAFDDKS